MFFGIGLIGGAEDILLAIGAWFVYQQLRALWDNHPNLSQNKRLRDVPFFVAGVLLLLCQSPQWVNELPSYGIGGYFRYAIFLTWAYLGLNGLWHVRKWFIAARASEKDDTKKS